MYTLKLLLNDSVKELYKNHSTFHDGDSGYDLFFPETVSSLQSGESYILDLKIKAEMIDNNGNNISYLLLPRSSISKTKFRQSNSVGLIDAGYRGSIKVPIDVLMTQNEIKTGKFKEYSIEKETRLVQLCSPDFKPFKVEFVDKLSETARGEGGFGSTGK